MALQAHARFPGQKSTYIEFSHSLNSPQNAVDVLRDSHFPCRAVILFWGLQDNLVLALVFPVLASGSGYSQYHSSVYLLEVALD